MKIQLISWRYYLILVPVHVLTVLFTIAPQPLRAGTLPKWILVTIISYALMAIPFALVNHFKANLNTFAKQCLALSFVGLVRGFVILDASLILNLPTIKPYILRPLNSAVSVPLWFLIAHFIIGSREKFRTDFHEMYTRSVHAQIAVMKSTGKSKIEASAEVLSEKIDKALDPLRRQFEQFSGKKLSPKEIAEEALIIRSFIDQQIRPLSHELWRSKKFKPPKLSFSKIIIHSLFQEELPLFPVLIPAVIFGLTGLTSVYGISQAILIGLPSWSTYAVVAVLYQFALKRSTISKSVLNPIALMTILFAVPLLQFFLRDSIVVGEFILISAVVGTGFYFLLILAFSVHNSVEKFYDSIRNIMSGQIAIAQSEPGRIQEVQLAQEYAAYLHGDVQSQLLSASMQMDRAADEKNVKLGNKAMKRASNVLRRDHQSYVVGSAIDSRAKVQKLIDSWSGITTIRLTMEKTANISDIGYLTIYRVLEDLISNAVRHGGSTEIDIKVEKSNEDILLKFRDNGLPYKRGKKGLGSEILEQEALSFKHARVSERNQLEILLPD